MSLFLGGKFSLANMQYAQSKNFYLLLNFHSLKRAALHYHDLVSVTQ
jgi:hypothetical protein